MSVTARVVLSVSVPNEVAEKLYFGDGEIVGSYDESSDWCDRAEKAVAEMCQDGIWSYGDYVVGEEVEIW